MNEKVILEGVVGSHAYGLNGPDSDIDTAGVFVVPTDLVLGIRGFQETIVRQDGADKNETPDVSYHEVGKFIYLAMKANPTVLEQLFLDEYTKVAQEGQLLLDNRDLFISQRIRATHVGYAVSQIKRLKNRDDGSFSSTTRKRTAKHARHVYRLVLQGQKALSGDFVVKLSESEAIDAFAMGEMAVNVPQEFIDTAEKMLYDLENMPSRLPIEPDVDGINSVLLKIRKMN